MTGEYIPLGTTMCTNQLYLGNLERFHFIRINGRLVIIIERKVS